jgi:hypothetical protein
LYGDLDVKNLNITQTPFFLPRARVVVGKPSADADRPR